MPVSSDDGRFSAGYWIDPDSEEQCDGEEYADTLDEIRERAKAVLAAGRFKSVVLYEWNSSTEDWDELLTSPPDSLDD